jgi:hypothetical protein
MEFRLFRSSSKFGCHRIGQAGLGIQKETLMPPWAMFLGTKTRA